MDCCDPFLWPCCDQENLSTFKKIVVTSALECISAYIQYTVYIYIYILYYQIFSALGTTMLPNAQYIFRQRLKQPRGFLGMLIHIPTFLVSPSYLLNLVMYPYRYQPMYGLSMTSSRGLGGDAVPGDWYSAFGNIWMSCTSDWVMTQHEHLESQFWALVVSNDLRWYSINPQHFQIHIHDMWLWINTYTYHF